MILCLNGCAKNHYEALPTGNVGRLVQIQDFKEAKSKAPVFAKEALLTINSLEYQLRIEKNK